MKLAVYDVVRTPEEKKLRLADIKAENKNNPDFYSAYIDVAPEYNEAFSDRCGYRSLTRAIREGKVDTVRIPSFERMYMFEGYAFHLMNVLKEKGVRAILRLGNDKLTTDMTDAELGMKFEDYIQEYLFTTVSLHAITLEDCFFRSGPTPRLCLTNDAASVRRGFGQLPGDRQMLFIDALRECENTGFWFYRTDVSGWYYVCAEDVPVLTAAFDELYELMWEDLAAKFRST